MSFRKTLPLSAYLFVFALICNSSATAQIAGTTSATATIESGSTTGSSPTPSSTPTSNCICAKVEVLCVDNIEERCGTKAAACARPDLCVMFMKKGGARCGQILKNLPSVAISEQQLAPILGLTSTTTSTSTMSPTTSTTSIINWTEVESKILTSMDSTDPEVAKTTLPSATEIDDECAFEHELDHLCRKVDASIPCAVEPPALTIQAACYKKAVDKYCSGTVASDSPEESLCSGICVNGARFASRVKFTNCFCGYRSSGNTGNGFDACCSCVKSCKTYEKLPQCEKYVDKILTKVDEVCDSVLNSKNVHSCAYFGKWPPPWNERLVKCEATSATAM